MSLTAMLKSVVDGEYSEFRKVYKQTMNDEYSKNEKVVKQYVNKCVSLGKPTHIG